MAFYQRTSQIIKKLFKFVSDMLPVLLTVFSSIYYSDALVCLSCSNVPNPRDCNTVENCGPNSYCFLELDATSNGAIYYKVGCRDKLFCHSNHHRSIEAQTDRLQFSRHKRDTIVCQECCDTELCNAAGCTSAGYTTPRGPICYACAQQKSQDACNQIQLCGRDEFCYMEGHQYGKDYLYTSACMAENACSALGITKTSPILHAAPIIGRDVDQPPANEEAAGNQNEHVIKNRQTTSSNSRLCCTSDLCNNNGSLVPDMVDGGWSVWSSWSKCSVTCDYGAATRSRSCTNPAPRHGGANCVGISQGYQVCKDVDCPIDGEWSDWSSWSSCSATCGSATKSRSRSCDNPAPKNGGKACPGSSMGQLSCSLQSCPIDGMWSGWSSWSSCSATCGSATKSRSRSCNNPAPKYGGKACPGSSQEQLSCILQSCSIDGVWSDWSSWSGCSASCGAATRARSRLCNNPAPQHGGKACPGSSQEQLSCSLPSCPTTSSSSATTTNTGTYTCLACSASASPRDCNFVQQCGPNSICYLEKHLTTGFYFSFYSGCRDRQFCQANKGRRAEEYSNITITTEDFDIGDEEDSINKDKVVCSECCEGDLCNSQGCGQPGYPATQGPVCYKCDQQPSPHHCNEITVCNTDEACHLTFKQFIGVIYSSGCHKKSDCMAKGYLNTGPVTRIVGRRAATFLNSSHDIVNQSDAVSHRDRRGLTPCSKCCTGNLCNRDTCQNVLSQTTHHAVFTKAPTTPTVTTNHMTSHAHGMTTASTQHVNTQTHHHKTTKHHHGSGHHVMTTARNHVITHTTQRATSHGHHHGQSHIVSTCPQWGSWTQWSDCNEVRVQLTGYAERRRTCNDGNYELDKHYCGKYTTAHCIPPSITDIAVTAGSWTTGDTVIVECQVQGDPKPTVTWKCSNNCGQLPNLFEYGNILSGQKMDSTYSGTYTCQASNSCGTATKDYVARVT